MFLLILGKVFQSLLITCTVSTFCSLIFTLFGVSFWYTFAIVCLLQWITNYVVHVYIKEKNLKEMYLAELSKLEDLSTLLNCAYCNTQNVVTFLPESVTDFKCTNCNNINHVKLNFTISRSTGSAPDMQEIQNIIKEPQTNNNIKL